MKMPAIINLVKQRPVLNVGSSPRAILTRLISALKIATFLASFGLLGSACADAREFKVTGEGENDWSKASEQLLKADTSANGCAIDSPTKAQVSLVETALIAANTADKNAAPATPADALSWDWGSGEVILHGGACKLVGVGGEAPALATPPEFMVEPNIVKIGETVNVTVTGPDNFSFENPEVDTLGCKGLTVANINSKGKAVTFDLTAIRGRCGAQPGDVKIAIVNGPDKARDTHLVDFTIEKGDRRGRRISKGKGKASGRPCTEFEKLSGVSTGKTTAGGWDCRVTNGDIRWSKRGQ